MSLGVEVRTRLARVARGIPVDTGTWFVTGDVASGETDVATLVGSIADFETAYGQRASGNQDLYDAVEFYFGEGGKRAFVGPKGATLSDTLNLFPPELGPGQVSAIGEEAGTDTYNILYAHAAANNRVAVLDVAVDSTGVAMSGLGGVARGLANKEYGAVFGSWCNIPPPAGIAGGSAREAPASPAIAALCARADALGNPNRAAAGRDFPLQFATGFVKEFGKVDRENILDAGVNTFATIFGVLENYGFQTAVEQVEENPYWQFNCARARMWLKARSQAIGEPYVFKPIDGRGRLQQALKGALDGVGLELYGMDGLFGETPQEAFATTVDATVNTLSSIAQGELHAVMEARLSLHARAVLIDLVTIPVVGQVSVA